MQESRNQWARGAMLKTSKFAKVSSTKLSYYTVVSYYVATDIDQDKQACHYSMVNNNNKNVLPGHSPAFPYDMMYDLMICSICIMLQNSQVILGEIFIHCMFQALELILWK